MKALTVIVLILAVEAALFALVSLIAATIKPTSKTPESNLGKLLAISNAIHLTKHYV